MNVILIGGIFCCFVFVGVVIYRTYHARKVYFECLVRFCDALVVEIGFSKRTIAQVIDGFVADMGCNSPFRDDILGYKNLLEYNQDITRERIVLWDKLKPNEARGVVDFLLELGRHSVTEELEKIGKARARFEFNRAEATDKLKKEASIYLKISIIIGIGVVILLL